MQGKVNSASVWRINPKIWLVMSAFLLGMVGTAFAEKIIYVNADANGLNNGSSWSNAYKFLQDALADARSSDKPVEIRVAQGVYKPDQGKGKTPGDRKAAFQLINGVTIKGGYAGFGKPDPNTRDVVLYETILSGNIGGLSYEDNCYHVFYHPEGLNLDDTAILDGFTITAGNAGHYIWPHDLGGGMFNYKSSPTVKDCTFNRNSARKGGGMYSYSSNPMVSNSTFIGNSANDGGGMANCFSSPTVTNCTFSGNLNCVCGGGMFNEVKCSPVMKGCTFSGNSANIGGGMDNSESSPSVNNCTFNGNSAVLGGGMCNRSSSPTVSNCTFSGNSASDAGGGMDNDYSSPTVTNCTFSDNSAQYLGGGMGNWGDSSPTVSNCTISGNSAWAGGGLYCNESSPNVTNCEFNGNSAYYGSGMYNYDSSPSAKGCAFNGNSAEYGGGMGNYNSSPTVENCTFIANSAGVGGGMSNDVNSSPAVKGCTFSGNAAYGGGGMENSWSSSPIVTNCIFWSDTPSEIRLVNDSTVVISYSDIQGAWQGVGNIDSDPCFVQPKGWILIQGLISYWKFDEGSQTTALDSVGKNNGTIYGAQWTVGQIGGALDFDGDNDYVSILANPALDNLNAITLEAWIYPRKDSHWHILDKGDGDKRLYAEGTSLSMDGRVRYSGNHAFVRSTSNTVILDTWQHVVLTWSRLDNTSRLYRNGVEVNYSIKTIGSGNVLDDTSHPWTIGARGALGEVTFFDGLIDEAALYDRVLSAQEIQEHYQKGLLGQGYLDESTPDYHLLPGSPCINAGDPCYVPEPNETDMDGEARIMWETVDMGADEFNPIRLGIVNKKRVARTKFVYDCNITFTNLWPFAVKNAELQMLQASENMTIIEPNVIFGDIEFNTRQSITSIDTCTFQVDRSKPIDPKKIVWKVKCQRIDNGQPLELTINGVGSGALDGATEGKIGLEDLAKLADQWLWVGEAGSIKEDITGDGIVNLADLAALAVTPR